MRQHDSSADEVEKLQQETMRQLDSISKEIEAGTTTLEAGSKRAEALVKESQVRISILAEKREKEIQRKRFVPRLIIGASVLAMIAYLIFKYSVPVSGSAL